MVFWFWKYHIWRCMYSDDKVLATAQKVMLEILKEIHKLCVKHDITYFLNYGTLLGAVRHNGFIPWDDDCDICMPRKDYDKFIEVASKELPSCLFVQTPETDPGYKMPMTKVRKLGTLLIETGETGNEPYCHGIFVDIFPFDYYKYGWFLKWLRWRYTVRNRKKGYKKGSVKRLLITIYTNIVLMIPIEFSKYVFNYFDGKLQYFSNCNYDYMDAGIANIPCGFKKKDILPVKLGVNIFEGESFFVPANSDALLKMTYGEDYMKPLPPAKRVMHNKKIELNVNVIHKIN